MTPTTPVSSGRGTRPSHLEWRRSPRLSCLSRPNSASKVYEWYYTTEVDAGLEVDINKSYPPSHNMPLACRQLYNETLTKWKEKPTSATGTTDASF
jgi:hypothetical protein